MADESHFSATARLLPVFASILIASSALGADFDVASATNRTGVDLYRSVASRDKSGNTALSPYSIESALALAYEGADGVTREEMARVLHLPPDGSSPAASFSQARAMLDSSTHGSAEWHVADRLFGQKDYAFRQPYLTLLDSVYGAPLEPLDFRAEPEAARLRINSWVSDITREKIRDLIPPDGVDRHTRLVLVNALYLKALWETPFDERVTRDLPFHVGGGAASDVPTMGITKKLGYRRESGFTAVTVPYAGGDLQLLILLADTPDGIGALQDGLSAERLRSCAGIQAEEVSLLLPKFKTAGPVISLGSDLRGLGMRTAFDEPRGSANFDRIAPRRPPDYLALSEVYHKVFVEVDEKGTEAAASTAVVVFAPAAVVARPRPIQVRVDHPFLFAIQHRGSGLCLFLGRITDPRN